MKKVAVIIKHPYRDNDWRVDIYNVKETITNEELYESIMSEMLGHFEIIAMTEKVLLDNKI